MDSIANMIAIIKNGGLAGKKHVSMPFSKFRFEVAKVLEKSGFVGKVAKSENLLSINLIYSDNQKPRITQIKKISKQGLKIYTKSKNIKPIKAGIGLTIISTPQGVMTGTEAKNKNLGGEVICQVW